MEKIIKIVVDGKLLTSVATATLHSGCVGCALLNPYNPSVCTRYRDIYDGFTLGADCYDNKSIFIDDSAEHYSVAQVFAAIAATGVHSFITTDSALARVKEYLIRNNDTEYAYFLRLKNKFEMT